MRILIIVILVSLGTSLVALGQSKNKGKESTQQQGPTSFSPGTSPGQQEQESRVTKAKKKRKKQKKKGKTLVEEYEERMEALAKEYKRRTRKMKKPQYSDWTYFGHKRKPKKREPGKKKLCKECGIVH